MIQKGDIYPLFPTPAHTGKPRRLVVALRGQDIGWEAPSVPVAFLSKEPQPSSPFHLPIPSFTPASHIIADRITTVPPAHLGQKITQITDQELAALDGALCRIFSL